MDKKDIKIGMVIYHREVYDYREHLTVVGIRENEIEVEGDFSGGTHNIIQRSWLPFSGVSTIYDYRRKLAYRRNAESILCHIKSKVDETDLKMMLAILAHQMLNITIDIELNPEIK